MNIDKVSKDDNRPALKNVLYKKGYFVATDGTILIGAKADGLSSREQEISCYVLPEALKRASKKDVLCREKIMNKKTNNSKKQKCVLITDDKKTHSEFSSLHFRKVNLNCLTPEQEKRYELLFDFFWGYMK